jgi:transcriptional regulator with XRE-family HTH domain
MPEWDIPAVARRQVRLALREAREARHLTQRDVAEAMEWSLSKVQRIEKGDVSVAANDLRALLALLGIESGERVDDLVRAARLSRQRRRSRDERRFRQHIPPVLLQLTAYEAEVEEIRVFAPMLIPGFLQTRGYAEVLLRSSQPELPAETREVRLEFGQRRREELVTRADPPRLFVILDESVLYRHMGDLEMHRAQLVDLTGLVRDGRLVVRIMPLEMVASAPVSGQFEICHLGGNRADPPEDAVMYRESGDHGEIVEDAERVRRYRSMFEKLWHSSYDETKSLRLIGDRIK